MSITKEIVSKSKLDNLANSISYKSDVNTPMTIDQMKAAIDNLKLGISVNVTININQQTGQWERPLEWPNLDDIISDNFEGIYLTYDLTKTPECGFIGIYVDLKSSGNYIVERGHILNNEFVIDATNRIARQTCFREVLDSNNGDIQIWRVIPESDNHITRFGFVGSTSTSSTSQANQFQPCVERVGYLPYISGNGIATQSVNDSGYYANNIRYGTMWLQHDDVRDIGKNGTITSLYGSWYGCYSLQKLDFNGWDTDNFRLINLAYVFQDCYTLQKLNLNNWNTSSWTITERYGLGGAWSNCCSLKELDLSNWDTSGWAVTNLSSTWNGCYSLQKLNISTWDTSNWVVTTLGSTWANCYSLKELDLSNWNTDNWAVTTFNSTWNGCYSLQKLNISTWDTSNWAVTAFNSVWYSCCSLKKLDLSDWDTSDWAVTTLYYVWQGCYNLQELDISTWNTSNWAVTSLERTWQSCYSLKELDLSNWDTDNWIVTTLNSTWYGCYSLKELNISTWDTSNWAVTTLNSTWYNCANLKELDISDWNTSNWAVTTIGSAWQSCYNLKELDISSWNTDNWAVINCSGMFSTNAFLKTIKMPASLGVSSSATNNVNGSPNIKKLENFTGLKLYVNHTYANAFSLTKQSLLNIFNTLPNVTGSKTITIGQVNKLKLTTEQIAVATQKGWTVA